MTTDDLADLTRLRDAARREYHDLLATRRHHEQHQICDALHEVKRLEAKVDRARAEAKGGQVTMFAMGGGRRCSGDGSLCGRS